RPISLTGRYKLKGTLSQQSDINNLEFIVPGAKVDNPQQAASYNELPLYNKKVGVFNLVEAPHVDAVAWAYCTPTPQYSGNIRKHSKIKHRVAPQKSIPKIHPDLTIPYKPSKVVGKENVGPNIGIPPPGNSCSSGGYFHGVIAYQIYLN